MLKLGVYKRSQFFATPPNVWPQWLRYRLSRSRVSLDLLQLTCGESTIEDVQWFEGLMPHVRLSSGVYRTTFRDRFRDLDPILNRILACYFPPSDKLVVEDWAASACLTSLEWARSLFALFPQAQFAASDLELFLISVDTPTGDIYIAERDGKLLQYVHRPFVIRMEPAEPWTLPMNRLLYLRGRQLARKMAGIWPLPDEWLNDFSNQGAINRDGFVLHKISLIHPLAVVLARQDPRFSIRRHSIFERSANPCQVIRSMNILNRAYFPDERLAQSVRSIVASLLTGGIWIVGRTIREDPAVHEVTVFRKEGNSALKVLERVGPGSEIDALALGTINAG